ncbi:DUF3533 domain-containing protein [Bacillus sonorensis]|uniref:YhgE/Pip domain-containing protein n=1 Tax=Bacillus sonorensis TaxID=119858 RepID=UPI002DB791B0|nr:ABC transporter permease [Bacillus sonorensis]MEC1355896.1 DUF3533 domain-containing protein [Bacillus sonorensis]MEC1425699.1 DUF3533 domain-containing protein [Bacillus sonorensis]
MKLLKEKLLLFSPFIVCLVVLIFSLTLIPSVHPTPQHLPIAIVNEDQGADMPNQGNINAGAAIVRNIKDVQKANHDGTSAVKWVEIKNEKTAREGLNDRKYYAALLIPKDFSRKQASLQTPNPSGAKMTVLVNQGANPIAANAAGQIVNQVVDHINHQFREEIMTGFEKQGKTLTVKQAAALSSPVAKTVEQVNETGEHSANGNAPVSLVQPLWIASIAGALIVYTALRKWRFSNGRAALLSRFLQGLTGAVLAVAAGYSLVWIAADWVGISIPQIHDTALFIAICYFSFYLMITAVTSWIGFPGAGLFGLLFFFGTPLLTMAPEMMPAFYRDWFYSWLPMRFASDGLRDLLFFNKGLSMNQPVSVLLSIGAVSFLVLLASSLKNHAVSKEAGIKML